MARYMTRYMKHKLSITMADRKPEGAHYAVAALWNGEPIDHEPIEFHISAPDISAVQLDVTGPLFNDPDPPPGPPGQACAELWEFEVAEMFFLGESEQYLEVELCPHGQHLVLLLDGTRNMFKDKFELNFTAKKDEKNKTWTGTACIPIEYFPPGVNKINAYAIHGSGDKRQYEALFPASKEFSTPDFHRLQFFEHFDFTALFPSTWSQPESCWWKGRHQ